MLWHGANIGLDLSKSKTIDNLPGTTGRFKLALIQKRIYTDACGVKSYIRTRGLLQMHGNYRNIVGVFYNEKIKYQTHQKLRNQNVIKRTYFCNIAKEKL